MSENPLTAFIKPYAKTLIACALNGDMGARQVINLYQMHVACPSDPGAPTLCQAAFEEWKRNGGADAPQ